MREIKFRAWLKATQIMCDVKEIYINERKLKININVLDAFVDFEKVELMQYTGLHDKNGKEIYEGDIVEYDCGDDKVLYIVEWSEEGYYSIRKVLDKDWDDYIFCRNMKNFKVIGNIYENPELLELK